MKVDYIALSIPIFFLLIGIELFIAVWRKQKLYRFNDSITNISLGIGQQVIGIFMKTGIFFTYLFIFTNYRFWNIEATLLNWVLLFFAVDFFYYWFHRLSHEVNALWAAHIVHHQSEEYNLSVALRQSWFQNAFSWVFYLPLAFVGFEPVMFLTISSFNTLYQFWIHTRIIGRMGFLELFLNTPSHHRVHHGSNPKYIDKNHAGTLIIWDRMFGTFQNEEEEPIYGVTKPLKSWNPVWANFHYWYELIQMAKLTRNISDKIALFLKPPGWRPSELGGREFPTEINVQEFKKYNEHPHQLAWNYYVLYLFVLCLAVSTILLFKQSQFTGWQLLLSSGFSILTLVVCGGILENKKWTYKIEFIRIAYGLLLIFSFYPNSFFKIILIGGLALWVISISYFLVLLKTKSHFLENR